MVNHALPHLRVLLDPAPREINARSLELRQMQAAGITPTNGEAFKHSAQGGSAGQGRSLDRLLREALDACSAFAASPVSTTLLRVPSSLSVWRSQPGASIHRCGWVVYSSTVCLTPSSGHQHPHACLLLYQSMCTYRHYCFLLRACWPCRDGIATCNGPLGHAVMTSCIYPTSQDGALTTLRRWYEWQSHCLP